MCRTTLLACDFGYGDASFQPAIEYALLQRLPILVTQASSLTSHAGFQRALSTGRMPARRNRQDACVTWDPVEAEPVGALNSHIHKLPNKFLGFACWPSLWRSRKYDNLVCAGSPHQARTVCFAGAFAKHFHLASDQAFKNPAIRFVYYLQQILIALFFQIFVDLIRHFRGGSIAPRRITKHESVIELDFLDQIARLFIIFFCFARKSDDYISGYRNAVARPPNSPDKVDVFFCRIRAVHRFQDFVRARLQRQMNVLGKFRELRDCIDQVIAETNRVGGSETKSLKAFDLVNGFEQLHERGFVVDLRKFMATVKIHDLPQ